MAEKNQDRDKQVAWKHSLITAYWFSKNQKSFHFGSITSINIYTNTTVTEKEDAW